MTAHDLVNVVLVVAAVAIFMARTVGKFAKSAAQRTRAATTWSNKPPARVGLAQQQPPAPVPPPPAVAPAVPRRPRPARPATQALAAAPIYAAEAAAAFPALDLTLPDAEAPIVPGGAPSPRRARRSGLRPGDRGWGAQAIVALEILGPPVSLRSGATLGAPHAF